jgi:hypothetical protein
MIGGGGVTHAANKKVRAANPTAANDVVRREPRAMFDPLQPDDRTLVRLTRPLRKSSGRVICRSPDRAVWALVLT